MSTLDVDTLAPEATLRLPAARAARLATARAFYQLTKPNLSALVMITGVLGYWLRAPSIEPLTLLHLIVGLWCTSGGAGALNMVIERHLDAKMRRTQVRPIPSGRVTATQALVFAVGLFAFGFAELFLFTSVTTALLALATLVLYAAVYTPLKSKGPIAIAVGAIPGAIPPVMGWAAVDGGIDATAWLLFALLFAWQFPHFLALAWMYREDYARAGFDFLPQGKREAGEAVLARRTGMRMVIGARLLLPITWGLVAVGAAHALFLVTATILGVWFSTRAVGMVHTPGMPSARATFFGSIIYLPLLLVAIVIDRALLAG